MKTKERLELFWPSYYGVITWLSLCTVIVYRPVITPFVFAYLAGSLVIATMSHIVYKKKIK